jgi:hypothetical protein
LPLEAVLVLHEPRFERFELEGAGKMCSWEIGE